MIAAKVAIVTGGSRGIGRAVAERLASEGVTVAVSYAGMRGITSRSAERAAAAQRFATKHGVTLLPLEFDVLSDTGCRAAVSGVAAAFTPGQQFLTILDTNAVSRLRTVRAALPVMRRPHIGQDTQ